MGRTLSYGPKQDNKDLFTNRMMVLPGSGVWNPVGEPFEDQRKCPLAAQRLQKLKRERPSHNAFRYHVTEVFSCLC